MRWSLVARILMPLSLDQKRLFYWTIRFVHADSCRYIGQWTQGLQDAAHDDTLQAYVNWVSNITAHCVSFASVELNLDCVAAE